MFAELWVFMGSAGIGTGAGKIGIADRQEEPIVVGPTVSVLFSVEV